MCVYYEWPFINKILHEQTRVKTNTVYTKHVTKQTIIMINNKNSFSYVPLHTFFNTLENNIPSYFFFDLPTPFNDTIKSDNNALFRHMDNKTTSICRYNDMHSECRLNAEFK